MGVAAPGWGAGEERRADLGLFPAVGAADGEPVREKGLLRRCAEPLALKVIARRDHQRVLRLVFAGKCRARHTRACKQSSVP